MKLKTGPRIVLGLLVVVGIGYGVNSYIDSRPKAAQPEQAVQAQVQPVQQEPAAPAAQQAPEPQPQPAPTPTPRTQSDAALNALINGGQK